MRGSSKPFQHSIKRSKTFSRAANHPRPGRIDLTRNAKPSQCRRRIPNAIPLLHTGASRQWSTRASLRSSTAKRPVEARNSTNLRLLNFVGAARIGFNHDLAHRGPSATARLALGHSDRHRPLRLAFSSVTWGRARLAHDEARPAAVEREKHSVRQVFDMARPAFAERVDVRYRKQIFEWNELAALD